MKNMHENLIFQYDKDISEKLNKKIKYIDADIVNKKIKINDLETKSSTYSDDVYYSGIVLTFTYMIYNLVSEDDFSILKAFLTYILGVGATSLVSGLIKEYIDCSIKKCYNDLQQLEEQKIKMIDELKEAIENNNEQGLSYLKK